MITPSPQRLGRWYFGGLASAAAACCTHPLDLIKVHLQTQNSGKLGIFSNTISIVRHQGITSLYNGLSASLLRQLTYSTSRFALYEFAKQRICHDGQPLGFTTRVGIASVAGFFGGIVGTPGDMINVRMQNDIKLDPELRRHYRHAIDGLVRVAKEEGLLKLFSGADWAAGRAALMTIGQLCFYDVVKERLLASSWNFRDNLTTHFASSLAAGAIATTMTQPLDVLKTRAMNAKPGEFRGAFHLFAFTMKQGPLAFYKGYVPAFIRLGPHTIITFLFFEQLKKHFGYIPTSK